MARREVVWSTLSEIQLKEILVFFTKRNKSGTYSRKLYRKFKSELKTVAKNPEIGIRTKLDLIRGLIIDDYILFYEIIDDKILVLTVWDCRQNPDNLSIAK